MCRQHADSILLPSFPEHACCGLQDGGDPAVDVSPRDIIYTMPAAGDASPSQFATTDLR